MRIVKIGRLKVLLLLFFLLNFGVGFQFVKPAWSNHPPNQPSNVFPPNGAPDMVLAPILRSSDFSDPDSDVHAANQWQVTVTPGDYSSPVWDSGRHTNKANGVVVTWIRVSSEALDFGVRYYWMVRHQDSDGDWSVWSSETYFTMCSSIPPNNPPNQPSNISPANGDPQVELRPTFRASAFYDPDPYDIHYFSQWQVTRIPGDYSNPVWDIYGDNYDERLTQITFGTDLEPSTTYYWMVRYRDSGYPDPAYSTWSVETSFTTISSGLQRVLSVSSAHDSPNPPNGAWHFNDGQYIVCTVKSPVTEGATIWTCTGWTGTGSVPPSGTGKTVTLPITQDSSITWNWRSEENRPSTLSNGYVSPSSGDTSTTFEYYVSYADPEGDVPTLSRVYVDDSPHAMVKVAGSYVSGATFRYSTSSLADGSHQYYFSFSDGHDNTVELPSSGTYLGPSVSSTPTSGFAIVPFPTSLTVEQGKSDNLTITVFSVNGFNQPVQLSISEPPLGVTANFNPAELPLPSGGSAKSTLTLSVRVDATLGGPFILTVTGKSGSLRRSVSIYLQITGNQPLVCAMKLLKGGVQMREIRVGEFFDIYVGGSSGGAGIKEVRFLSDEFQNGEVDEGFTWTEFYSWTHPSEPWDDSTKIMRWAFATGGEKEVWAEVTDVAGRTAKCSASIYANEPIQISIDRKELFYALVQIKKLDYDSYDVSLEVLNGKKETIQTKCYIETFNAVSQTSKYSFKLTGALNRIYSLYLFLNPARKEDLLELNCIILKITYSNPSLSAEKYEELCFDGFTNVVATTFDLGEDAYSFSNIDTPGKGSCYGMAATSVLYFKGELTRPNNKKTTYDLTLSDAMPNIKTYQDNWLINWFSPLADNKLSNKDYERLKTSLGNGRPMLFFLSKGLLKDHHTVVAYRIIERQTESYILVCDNNQPLAPPSFLLSLAYCFIKYDRRTCELSYSSDSGYCKFALADAMKSEPWTWYMIACPTELRIYDSQGRVTGVIDGEIREEIPLSFYSPENGTVTILYPCEQYRCEVNGTDNGTYDIWVDSSEDGRTTTFSAHDIPTSLNAVHQYIFDWDSLSQGYDGVTILVDSNGDQVFESAVTSASELNSTQFLAGKHRATDLNDDGKVDIQDITAVAIAYNSRQGDSKWNPAADFNDDQWISIVDVALLAKDYGK